MHSVFHIIFFSAMEETYILRFIFLEVLQPKNLQQHTALNMCEHQASHKNHHFFLVFFPLHICAKWYSWKWGTGLPSVPFISSMQIFCTSYTSSVGLKVWTHGYCQLCSLALPSLYILISRTEFSLHILPCKRTC